MLARSTLILSDPTTYAPAYDCLARAASLISSNPLPAGADIANYTRCISSAFHNIAGSFYQSGKYGPAVRFMRRSCDLGEQALELKRLKKDKDDEQESTSQQEGWRSLEQQILGRWELLGVCCSKIGDRHVSYFGLPFELQRLSDCHPRMLLPCLCAALKLLPTLG
jgi:separase